MKTHRARDAVPQIVRMLSILFDVCTMGTHPPPTWPKIFDMCFGCVSAMGLHVSTTVRVREKYARQKNLRIARMRVFPPK